MPGLTPETTQMLNSFWPFLLMAIVFYFLLYRPQKKEQKKRATLLDNLKKGDRVITIGGVYGTITALTDKKVTLRVADRVEVDFVRTAVSHYQEDATK